MTDGKTVLVLGGGVGGLIAANRLCKLLPSEHRVLLLEREREQVFQPSLLWLAVGTRRPDAIRRPLARLAHRRAVVRIGVIDSLDAQTRTVRLGAEQLVGDALIVALGADLAPEAIPGLADAGHNLYSLSGATAFRDQFAALRSGRLVVLTATPAYKCPAAPYEAAMLIESALRRRRIRGSVQIDVYAAEAGPMGVTGPETSQAVRAMVESKGIVYHPEHQVTTVDPVARRISFAGGGSADFDLLLYVPPHRAPSVVREAGLLGESGWVSVDRHTFATRVPGVYAIGDVTGIPLVIGKPLPKAGVFAHAGAEVVAANIAGAWTGRGGGRTFDGEGGCFVETGDGRAGFGAGNFYATPSPQVKLRAPGRMWHWGKMLVERRWLGGWG